MDLSPGIVFIDVQRVGVQQQSTPGEEAARGQHANVGTGGHASQCLKVQNHLLRVDRQTILWHSGQQDPTHKEQAALRMH